MLNRGETLKLKRSERRVHRPEDDLAGLLPGVAAGRAHLSATYGDAGLQQAAARLRPGARHRRGAEGGAEHRPRPDAGRLRPDARADVRRAAPRAGGAGRATSCRKMPLDELQTLAAEQPAQLSRCRWRSARALRKAGRSTRRCRRSSAPRRWCRSRRRTDSPHAQIAAIALEKKDRRARHRRAARRWSPSTSTTSRRRGSSPTLMRKSRHRAIRRSSRRSIERIVAIDPFDADAHAMLGRLAMAAQRRRCRGARVPGRRSRSDRSIRRRRTPISPRATSRAASAPRRKKQTLAALEIAPSYERAQDLLLKLAEARQ